MAGDLTRHSLSVGSTCLIDFFSSFRETAVAHAPWLVGSLRAFGLASLSIPELSTARVAYVRHSGPA